MPTISASRRRCNTPGTTSSIPVPTFKHSNYSNFQYHSMNQIQRSNSISALLSMNVPHSDVYAHNFCYNRDGITTSGVFYGKDNDGGGYPFGYGPPRGFWQREDGESARF